jgi:hypothetical protein
MYRHARCGDIFTAAHGIIHRFPRCGCGGRRHPGPVPRSAAGSVIFTANLEHKPFLLHALITPSQWNGLEDREDTLPLDHFTTIALLDQAVFVPQTLMIDGQQPARMKSPFEELKALQADALGTWSSFHEEHVLQSNGDLATWVDRIRTVASQPPYKFTAIYVAVVDPKGIGEISGAKEIYAAHGYRLWDVSTKVYAGG